MWNPSSRISPPEPVAAPGLGAIAVGWLWVSTFIKIALCSLELTQANSEHCRHKIFNADWTIDGVAQAKSLFAMIRNTYQQHPEGLLSVYSDNSAVMAGYEGKRFYDRWDCVLML
jgi:hypothetical protein